jgi:nicotinate phosphoribosyltransferase
MTVEGRSAVKLSDNPRKSTGPADEIARYRRVFNSPAADETEVLV